MNVTPKAGSSWKDQKVKLISKFPVLNDADCVYEDGKKDQMMANIQKKIGKTKEELTAIISAL